jgi:hypothetical protein
MSSYNCPFIDLLSLKFLSFPFNTGTIVDCPKNQFTIVHPFRELNKNTFWLSEKIKLRKNERS